MSSWDILSTEDEKMANSLCDAINLMEDQQPLANLIYSVFEYVFFKVNSGKLHPSLVFAIDRCLQAHPIYTPNCFTAVAHILNRQRGIDQAGTVYTPQGLAREMINLSVFYWLKNNTQFSTSEIVEWIFKGSAFEVQHPISELVSNLSWYDPCIGTGNFGIEIVDFYMRKGLLKVCKDINIIAAEIDELSLVVAKCRIAYQYSSELETFNARYKNLDKRFKCINALQSHSEQLSVFATSTIEEKFDIVIGNPPYVRSEKIPVENKKLLTKLYPSLSSGKNNLYYYFISHGLNALKEQGTLCYVSQAEFAKKAYSRKLRNYIDRQGSLQCFIDFDELPVFPNHSLHTAVYAISKVREDTSLIFNFSNLPSNNWAKEVVETGVKARKSTNTKGEWFFSIHDGTDIFETVFENCVPLESVVGGIYSGIKSGHKKAFFYSEKQVEQLDLTKNEKELFKRMLLPKEINKWASEWQGNFLLCIPKNFLIEKSGNLFRHLLSFKNELEARSDVKTHNTWYGMRECSYAHLFNEPKILFPDISSRGRFTFDNSGLFIPDGAFMIAPADLYILGLLNSSIGMMYFRQKCSSIGSAVNDKARLRFKKTYVKSFPVPSQVSDELRKKVESLVSRLISNSDVALERELDKLILTCYGVDHDRLKDIQERKPHL